MGPQDWQALLGIGTAVVGGLLAFHFRVVRPAMKTFKAVGEMVPKVEHLAAEFSPNGGLSMKDRITNIDNSVRMLKHQRRQDDDCAAKPLFECDANGTCVYANYAMADLLGVDRESLLGRGWLSAIRPDDRLEQWEQWIGSVRNGIPYAAVYEVQNARTKKKFIVKATAHVVSDGAGNPLRYFGHIERHQELPSVQLSQKELSELQQTQPED